MTTSTEEIVEIDGDEVYHLSDQMIQIINSHTAQGTASASHEAAESLAICAALLMKRAPPDTHNWFHAEVDRLIIALQPKAKPKLYVVPDERA
jgi:hypothetical protein